MTDKTSFAYRHLEKKGWSEGFGLGKKKSGNKDPIKVNLKHDMAGLGHDRGKDFSNQWWDHVFNKAAAKVSVSADGDEVKVKSEALSEESKTKLKQKTLYENFIKSGTLEQGKETHSESDQVESDDASKPVIPVLTDEQLLQACGGRTAHKGARHGFKMNGKLARVEQQDFGTCKEVSSADSDSSSDRCSPKLKKKKQKKTRNRSRSFQEGKNEVNEVTQKKKKKKKDKKNKFVSYSSDIDVSDSTTKISKKKRKADTTEINDITHSKDVEKGREKKKKKSKNGS